MAKRNLEFPRRPARKHPFRRSRSQAALERRREYDELLLRLKLAAADERTAIVAEIAGQEKLTLAERRQALLAVQKYILGRRSEMPRDLAPILGGLNRLASQRELQIKTLSLYRQALDALSRRDVVTQLQQPLLQLMQQMLPKGTRAEFEPELFIRVSQRLEQAQDTGAVINLASLGLFFFPFHGPLRELRADFNLLHGNLEGAEADFAQLVEQFPERYEYLLDHADVLLQLDDFDRSLAQLTLYLQRFPKDPEAMRRQAECLSQIGRGHEALRVLDKLMQLEGESASVFIWRAQVYEQMDLYDDAIADAEHALELDPQSQEARHLRQGLILRRQSFGMEDDLYSAFNRGEEEQFLGQPVIPDTKFADVGGLEAAKQAIKETILYPLKYKELSERYGKRAGGGILLFGPPGCGKTLLARAAAGECGVYFINVNLSSVLDKWVGNTEKAVSMIFKAARKRAPSIIFLDEVDAIGGSRASLQAGWEKKLISQLLVEVDGITSDNRDVMLLAASNAPWEVDFALRRPGRLGNLVFVPPPKAADRAEIFRLYLHKRPFIVDGIDCELLGARTEHFSADAIRQIVENAASIPWREAIETGRARPVSQDDLLAAIEQAKPDLAEWEKLVGRYKDFAERSLKQSSIGFRRQPQQT